MASWWRVSFESGIRSPDRGPYRREPCRFPRDGSLARLSAGLEHSEPLSPLKKHLHR